MKKWLLHRFLPMWAKETVLRDNKRLCRQLQLQQQRIAELEAHIRGIRLGLRAGKAYHQGGTP